MPVRIAIVNDYEIVVAGVAALLAPFEDRVQVVELDSGQQVVSDVDVILYDTFGQIQGDGVDLEQLVHGGDAKVAIFTWNVQPDLVQRAIARGARGYLSKALTAEEIVMGLEAIHRGEVVTDMRPLPGEGPDEGDWPGRELGLTQRESEVLALITQGLTNQEIADRAYISINSVKTYIRTAYRKIGVQRRAQAVSWGMDHGFRPDRRRIINGVDAY
ncbi:response regulator transcription factor [Nocardioides coralli]|uniref:response regulator transcription factor n=1 Tax=Nocardioides coralli TaxID=2872154 RepID=UPI001CA3EFE9|nr:response regulator transcription factor [Nocardioides coralli]QZY28328.1 response regulator transcription factor [Nocardioides coralli]